MTQNQFIVLTTTLRHDIAADLDRRANELARQRNAPNPDWRGKKFNAKERLCLYIAEQALRSAASDVRRAQEFHPE